MIKDIALLNCFHVMQGLGKPSSGKIYTGDSNAIMMSSVDHNGDVFYIIKNKSSANIEIECENDFTFLMNSMYALCRLKPLNWIELNGGIDSIQHQMYMVAGNTPSKAILLRTKHDFAEYRQEIVDLYFDFTKHVSSDEKYLFEIKIDDDILEYFTVENNNSICKFSEKPGLSKYGLDRKMLFSRYDENTKTVYTQSSYGALKVIEGLRNKIAKINMFKETYDEEKEKRLEALGKLYKHSLNREELMKIDEQAISFYSPK